MKLNTVLVKWMQTVSVYFVVALMVTIKNFENRGSQAVLRLLISHHWQCCSWTDPGGGMKSVWLHHSPSPFGYAILWTHSFIRAASAALGWHQSLGGEHWCCCYSHWVPHPLACCQIWWQGKNKDGGEPWCSLPGFWSHAKEASELTVHMLHSQSGVQLQPPESIAKIIWKLSVV